jgi:hypothetical protein
MYCDMKTRSSDIAIRAYSPAITKVVVFEDEKFLLKLYHLHTNSYYFELERERSRELFRTRETKRCHDWWLLNNNETFGVLQDLMEDIRTTPREVPQDNALWKSHCQFGRMSKGYYIEIVLRPCLGLRKLQRVDRHCFKLASDSDNGRCQRLEVGLSRVCYSLETLRKDLITSNGRIDKINDILSDRVVSLNNETEKLAQSQPPNPTF